MTQGSLQDKRVHQNLINIFLQQKRLVNNLCLYNNMQQSNLFFFYLPVFLPKKVFESSLLSCLRILFLSPKMRPKFFSY